MRTLLYISLIIGVLLPSINTESWDLEKMKQCSCASNATKEIMSAVATGCITDGQGKRVTLRLSLSDSDGCYATIEDQTTPGEIDVFMTYNGKLEDSTKQSQELEAGSMDQQDNTGSMDQQDNTGSMDQQNNTRSEDQQNNTGSVDQQNNTGSMDQQDNTGSMDQQDNTGSMDQQDNTGSMDQQDNTGSMDQQDNTGSMDQQDNPDGEMEFIFQVNVENGKITDTTEPMKKSNSGIKIRKREIMPFNIVNFNIIIKLDQEASCDIKDQTKPLLIRGIKRYWFKMTYCLLDVTE